MQRRCSTPLHIPTYTRTHNDGPSRKLDSFIPIYNINCTAIHPHDVCLCVCVFMRRLEKQLNLRNTTNFTPYVLRCAHEVMRSSTTTSSSSVFWRRGCIASGCTLVPPHRARVSRVRTRHNSLHPPQPPNIALILAKRWQIAFSANASQTMQTATATKAE